MRQRRNKTIFLVMISEEFSISILPFPLLYVGSALKKAGYEVLIRHIKPDQMSLTVDEIVDVEPLMVGFSVLTGFPTLRSAIMSEKIKERCDTSVVWGGVHPSLLPEQCASEKYIDYVVIGEGEVAAVELANALSVNSSLARIPGLAYKDHTGKVLINECPDLHINLEQYKLDFSLIHLEKYISEEDVIFQDKPLRVRSLGYCASRGCPYSCSFCYNQKFNKRKWRAPSEEFVINDINALKSKYGITKVHFWDDNFFVDHKRAYSILKAIDLVSGLDLRIDYINNDVARRLKELKVISLIFGVESGSNRMLNLMNKGFSVEQVIEAAKILGKLRMDTLYSAIFGLPTETKEEFNQTIEMLLEIKKWHKEATFTVGMYLPYPGTQMYDLAIKGGFKPPERTSDWNVIDRWRNSATLPWIDKKVCLNLRHLFILFLLRLSWPGYGHTLG
jgi:radical SAM superfamily enzyme YgiQ (UPF0313 family)